MDYRTGDIIRSLDVELRGQFDALIHLDRTEALRPLDRNAGWDEGEPPENVADGAVSFAWKRA